MLADVIAVLLVSPDVLSFVFFELFTMLTKVWIGSLKQQTANSNLKALYQLVSIKPLTASFIRPLSLVTSASDTQSITIDSLPFANCIDRSSSALGCDEPDAAIRSWRMGRCLMILPH